MTAVKTLIKPTWTIEKLQEVTSHSLINHFIAINKLFEKLTPELRDEYRTIMSELKVNYYKSLNITTPMQLAIAMAEYDTNVFGSKVGIEGEEHKVTIEIEDCGCWKLMKNHPCVTPQMIESRGECYKTCVEHITKELGLKGIVEITGKTVIIHITK
jgi:hypothetical protein